MAAAHVPALGLHDLLAVRKCISLANFPLTSLARSRLSRDERLCNCSDNAQRANWFSKSTILHLLTRRSSKLQLCPLSQSRLLLLLTHYYPVLKKKGGGDPVVLVLPIIHVRMQRQRVSAGNAY